MSHFKERKEKNCLNCNAEVTGRYCYVCGQENTEPKQSVGHLISHFFNDITHFDGKFFSTMVTLIRRPGLLTLEYVKGRKASYVDPAKLYIFTSAVFFLIFFKTVGHFDERLVGSEKNEREKHVEALPIESLKAYSIEEYDTLFNRQELLQRARSEDSFRNNTFIGGITMNKIPVNVYDSVQQALTDKQKDGFLKRNIKHILLRLNEVKKKDPERFNGKLLNYFFHLFPQILFVSLPLFAGLLKLLYIRRKQFYYTDHVFFSIHLYTYTFISLLALFGLMKLQDLKHFGITDFLQIVIITGLFVYQYKAMRTFYQQRRGKTIAKFLFLNILALLLMLFLISGFAIFTGATFE